MKSRWKDSEAKTFQNRYRSQGADLALRTYSARLIGQDPALVLHGGGNTSVKTKFRTLTGTSVETIYVKGSGWDLAAIEPEGHPAVKLKSLLELRQLNKLSDDEMVNLLRANMIDSSGPTPSVETLLHAFLPHKFVDHSHADAVLAVVDQPSDRPARELALGKLGIVPYVMPGFALSKLAAEVYENDPSVEGLLLMKHGIFTFGATARESYERMIVWVSRAEKFIAKRKAFVLTALKVESADPALTANYLRVSPLIVRHRTTPAILKFVNSRQAPALSQIGPPTPDHVLRTKPTPLYLSPGTNVRKAFSKFASNYQAYFKKQSSQKRVTKTPLDPLPKIVLVPGAGLFGLAPDAKSADMALDLYEHAIQVICDAQRVGRYSPVGPSDLFDVEYWSLEQAKLGKTKEPPFSRKIVWISGAASGIGLATTKAFLNLGAHVFMTDISAKALSQATEGLRRGSRLTFAPCDVTRARDVEKSFQACLSAFGGVDIVVSNAGIAPIASMRDCDDAILRKSFEINFFAHQTVAKTAANIMVRQGLGGALLFNASKSAFNPGPDFGPYSLPKAGVVALMKQYAVELGKYGIRSNAVNADRVRTGLFAKGLVEKRARARGLTVDEYWTGNLLGKEVFAEDVAGAFVYLASASKTTGAVIPVDGGNAAAFPR